jgi:hypothetical protein
MLLSYQYLVISTTLLYLFNQIINVHASNNVWNILWFTETGWEDSYVKQIFNDPQYTYNEILEYKGSTVRENYRDYGFEGVKDLLLKPNVIVLMRGIEGEKSNPKAFEKLSKDLLAHNVKGIVAFILGEESYYDDVSVYYLNKAYI